MTKKPNPNAEKNKKILMDLLKEDANKYCAECNARGPLCWASVNLGVFFCTRCAGVHRGVGVHISFVRGVTLDQWEDKHMENLVKVGNGRGNAYYEAGLPPSKKPTEKSTPREVEEFIRNKYDKKKWVVRSDEESTERTTPRKNPTQSPRNNTSRTESRSRHDDEHENHSRPSQKTSSRSNEDEWNSPRGQRPVQQQQSSSFAQISNRSSSNGTAPLPKPTNVQAPQKKSSASLFEFDQPEQPKKNDLLEDMFTSYTQPSQSNQQQQTQQQQRPVQQQPPQQNAPKSNNNILNLFDQPQNAPMMPQRPMMQQQFHGNHQYQQYPQQQQHFGQQQHYGHVQPQYNQQQHYPQHQQQHFHPQHQHQHQHQQQFYGHQQQMHPQQHYPVQQQQQPQGFGGQPPVQRRGF